MTLALFDISLLENLVSTSFAWSAKYFGAFLQVLMLATFFVGLGLAFSKYGKIKLGGLDKPELSLYK
ncbi:BCCT family transporter [Guptibacillus hwajinpoensis]|uniref:BCCT family transporter n=1 Tax=Guptibacillus hwajinpoensis TaxID=208199 RepID=UPI003D6B37BD